MTATEANLYHRSMATFKNTIPNGSILRLPSTEINKFTHEDAVSSASSQIRPPLVTSKAWPGKRTRT